MNTRILLALELLFIAAVIFWLILQGGGVYG